MNLFPQESEGRAISLGCQIATSQASAIASQRMLAKQGQSVVGT